MARIRLKKETGSYIHFCHPYWLGAVMLCLAGSFLLISLGENYQYVQSEARFIAFILGVGGLATWLYRLDVEFMPNNRKYRVTKGFWPMLNRREGSYDELIGTVLSKTPVWTLTKRTEKTKYQWTAAFAFTSFEKPIDYFTSINEDEARFQFERFAKHFQTKAFDRSDADKITELNWNQLEQVIQEEGEITQNVPDVDFNTPPEGVPVIHGKRGFQVDLAILGFRLEFILVFLIGMCLTTAGIMSFFYFSEQYNLGTTGLYLSISLFVAGVVNFIAGLVGLLGRERLMLYEGKVHSDCMFMSMPFWEISIPLDDVQEIKVRENSSDKWLLNRRSPAQLIQDSPKNLSYELIIQSDFQRILFGRYHKKETLEWFRAALIHKIFQIADDPHNKAS